MGCEFVSIVGDDICDDVANTEVCAYDFGDCCSIENDRLSSCQECLCFIDTKVQSTFVQKYCESEQLYEPEAFHELGDGNCHLAYNKEEYDFDLGDCCLDNSKCLTTTIYAGWDPTFYGISHDQVDCPDNVCIQSKDC